MLAVLFGALAGALFGLLAVAVRCGLTRGVDPEVGRRRRCSAIGLRRRRDRRDPVDGRRRRPRRRTSGRSCSVGARRAGRLADPLRSSPIRDAGPSRAVDPDRDGAAALRRDRADAPRRAVPARCCSSAPCSSSPAASSLARERSAAASTSGALGAVLALALRRSSSPSATTSSAGPRATPHPPPLVAPTVALARPRSPSSPPTCSSRAARACARRLRPAAPAFAPAGVALGLAYVCLLVAFDHGRVSIVAPLNATQSLWAVVSRRAS